MTIDLRTRSTCLFTAVSAALLAHVAALPSAAADGRIRIDELALTRPLPDAVRADDVSKIIFLNRCEGGCTIEPGINDARYNKSSIPDMTSYVTEFRHDDATWDAIVKCVQEVYAPYDIEVTDVDPGQNVYHHEAIVAGTPDQIGLGDGVGGVAPSQCTPVNNVISYTFANYYPAAPITICGVIAQESAHSFGLEHAFDCSDPMTYLPACGRQFFRDSLTPCGEFEALEQCQCGGSFQNSHRWLKTVLGETTKPLPGPVVEVITPGEGDEVQDGFRVHVEADDMRGLRRLELHINGTMYATVDGKPNDSSYQLVAPDDLADGVLDVEVIAFNDIDVPTVVAFTVTKGSPCQRAEDCRSGQECGDGRCFFPPATGALGDTCDDNRDCVSGLCPRSGDQAYCSEPCFPTNTPTCPDGFTCVEVATNEGVCWPAEEESGGGGCRAGVGRSGRGGAGLALMLAAMAMLVGARPRRRGAR
jgi:hypothetical protein